MSLRCLLGMHRPMLASIAKREQGYTALCEHCSAPLERLPETRWVPAAPIYERALSRTGSN